MDKTLNEIALDLPEIPDKSSIGHGYLEHYEQYFREIRNRPLKLLEIGVWHGSSLALWSAYFNRSQIVGCDIDLSICKVPLPDRTRLWEVNQSSAISLRNMVSELGNFDIIIDDGSHHPEHQILTFENLWPALRPGGFYCVEDLHPNYGSYKDVHPSMIEHLRGVIDDLNAHGKLGVARLENNPQAEQDSLLGRERDIAAIHFYRYLVIIQKAV